MKKYMPRRKPVGIQNSPFSSLRLRRDEGNEVIDNNERAMIDIEENKYFFFSIYKLGSDDINMEFWWARGEEERYTKVFMTAIDLNQGGRIRTNMYS